LRRAPARAARKKKNFDAGASLQQTSSIKRSRHRGARRIRATELIPADGEEIEKCARS
jgi:hypothetical protein